MTRRSESQDQLHVSIGRIELAPGLHQNATGELMELYEIKLYGFSSSDRNRFRQNLASILEISIDSAENLLARVPVIVKHGIPEADAERLCLRLRSISGWCAVLAENGDYDSASGMNEVVTSKNRDATSPSIFRPGLGEFYPLPWSEIPLKTVAILVVLMAAGLLIHVNRTKLPIAPPQNIIEAPQSQSSPTDTRYQESSADIEGRIRNLQSSLTSLYNRRSEIQESDKLTDPRLEELEIQRRIQAEYQEILFLRAQLAQIPSHAAK